MRVDIVEGPDEEEGDVPTLWQLFSLSTFPVSNEANQLLGILRPNSKYTLENK